MTNSSEIERILSGEVDTGSKVIQLDTENHKSVLVALMNLATSTIGNSDASASAELVAEFISDVKVKDLETYTFQVSDNVKTATFSGDVLRALTQIWGMCEVVWHVTRGGKRAQATIDVAKLGSLS